jgi:hypothetical protein
LLFESEEALKFRKMIKITFFVLRVHVRVLEILDARKSDVDNFCRVKQIQKIVGMVTYRHERMARGGHGLPKVGATPETSLPYDHFSGVARPQNDRHATVFDPFGHPMPYTYAYRMQWIQITRLVQFLKIILTYFP